MTEENRYQMPPNYSHGESMFYTPQKPPEKKLRWPWVVIMLLVIGCLAGGVIGIVKSVASSADNDAKPLVIGTTTPSAKAALTAADLSLKVTIRKSDCFDSAGALVEYRISVGIKDAARQALAKSDGYDVTYTVSGFEKGSTQVGTMTLNADATYDQDDYQAGQTATCSPKLKVKVSGIESH